MRTSEQESSSEPAGRTRCEAVLCVSRNETNLRVLGEQLARSGFEVLCDRDTGHAMRRIHQSPLKAAIIDFDMPGWDGAELAAILRAEIPAIPILMLSDGSASKLAAVSMVMPERATAGAVVDELKKMLKLSA